MMSCFCSASVLLPEALRSVAPGDVSVYSLQHKSHRNEPAKKETFELVTVLLCLPVIKPQVTDGKGLPVVAKLPFSLIVMDYPHVTSAKLHRRDAASAAAFISALQRPTCEMKHEI